MKLLKGEGGKIKEVGSQQSSISLGGHRSLTILIVALTLFIAGCVFFVNTYVLTIGSDPEYQSQATKDADLTKKFNASLLQKAKDFSANANSTSLPSGRINPFTP